MKKIGCLLTIPFTLALTIPWLWFLWGAVTWQSWLIGIWGLCLTWLPFSIGWFRKPSQPDPEIDAPRPRSKETSRPKFAFNPTLPILTLFLVLTIIILWQTPSRQSSIEASISNQYAPRSGEILEPSWFSLPNIVPEKEQINLGFRLIPLVDPVLDFEQSNKVAVATMQLYNELESDPEFRALGSVLGSGYCDITKRPFDNGHYFLYVPESIESETPKPAIVFLHGSGGNFKPYMWLWSKLAEKEGFVIIAPTFGFGEWNREGGFEAVKTALRDAKSKTPLHSDQIYIAGLSNGGLGVSQVVAQDAQTYKGAIFLSPIFDERPLSTREYLKSWRGRPHLVISGSKDRRTPIKYVTKYVKHFEQSRIDVTFKKHPGEDHFLFFFRAEEVLDEIGDWLRKYQRR